eukprot:2047576-Pyramimonas_sp.AAC.1
MPWPLICRAQLGAVEIIVLASSGPSPKHQKRYRQTLVLADFGPAGFHRRRPLRMGRGLPGLFRTRVGPVSECVNDCVP